MTDVFRREARLLTDKEAEAIRAFKIKAEELVQILIAEKPCREYSLAITRLEESVMWAVKGMTSGE